LLNIRTRKALEIAKANARNHKVHINFVYSDLLDKISNEWDIVVANLPYVPIKDYGQLKTGLKFEPILALTDGTDDSILYSKFLEQLNPKHLPKLILFEIDPSTKPILEDFVKQSFPQYKITFEQDIHKLWRYAILEKV
jgi:methylase of polypeptide subunit release factors